MIKNWFKSSKNVQAHPSEEELLRCVDGELSVKEAAQVRSHLETCWDCRLQLEKLEGTISAFVEFRQQIQKPLTQKPPKNWDDFNNKLKQAALETPSAGKNWFGSFSGFRKYFRQLTKFSDWTLLWKQITISAVAVVLITTIFWQFVFISNVSANELLDKASQFRSEKISQVSQAVIYQKLRVSRENAAVMNWELWRDTTRSRFRQNVSDEGTDRFNNELWQILQENGFNPQDPLSAVTFANWRKTLSVKTDTVENGKNEAGQDSLILQTVNLRADGPRKISAGILKVRAEDFHPLEQILRITTANGIETYTFRELDFQVVSLNDLKPDFFPESIEPQPTLTQVKPAPSPVAESNVAVTPSVEPITVAENTNNNLTVNKVESPKVTASADLEVDVLDLLNKAKADLGEQITVSRGADGLLYIRGIVENPTRKNEIYQSLQSIRNNPAVKIDIKTVDEAVAEQKNTPVPSGTAEKIESESSETATDSELLSYFKSEAAARAFGGQMMSRSSRAMSRAYALKRLVGQFNPDELKQLSAEAKDKWLALVSAHARAFREETESLRRELQPVFDGPNISASGTIDVNNIADIPRAVASLVEFASTNDRIVRSAFTLSSGNARFTAIKTTQFWQSLKNAEAIATKLQTVK